MKKNDKKDKDSNSKYFIFTVNNYAEDYKPEKLIKDFEYLIYQYEKGKECGTPHIQGYVCLFKTTRHSTLRKMLPGAYIDNRKGTHVEAKNYMGKEDTKVAGPFEFGSDENIPTGRGDRQDLKRLYSDLKELELPEIREKYPVEYIKYHRSINSIKKELKYEVKLENTDKTHLWYWGVSRTGKSEKARTEHPDAYLKICNRWWDNYNMEETVLIEDFDEDHKCLGHHLKIWADKYPFQCEVKGNQIKIRPKLIIVTSNWHPSEIWGPNLLTGKENKNLVPILERFQCIEFHKDLTKEKIRKVIPKFKTGKKKGQPKKIAY